MAVIVADETVRGGKRIALKSVMDAALERCPSVKTVLVDGCENSKGEVRLLPGEESLQKVSDNRLFRNFII